MSIRVLSPMSNSPGGLSSIARADQTRLPSTGVMQRHYCRVSRRSAELPQAGQSAAGAYSVGRFQSPRPTSGLGRQEALILKARS